MRRWRVLPIGCVLLLLFTSVSAQAGRTCSERLPTPKGVQKGLQLALKTRSTLDQAGAQVALLGRVGVDLSAYGLRYSHAGLVWRDHPKGRWLVIHALNHCATAYSAVFDEGLGNFFLDDPFAYEALLMIPSRGVQTQLVRLLSSPAPVRLHQHTYSMIAYPWATSYQNSNQWLLEVLAAALAPTGAVNNRSQAQAWLKAHGYLPSEIRLTPLTRLEARLFSANIRFDDHPLTHRVSGQYQVVTVESISRFVARLDPQSTQYVVSLETRP